MTVTTLRAERWFEVEVKIENQRPMRQLVKATSKREAFEITYKRYNTVTCDHDGAPIKRSAPAQVQVVDAAQRRLMPRPANRQRRATKSQQPEQPSTAAIRNTCGVDASRRPTPAPTPATTPAGPGLRGKTAFGNLQTGF